MSTVSLAQWNVSLGSADVSWGGLRALRKGVKETSLGHAVRFYAVCKGCFPVMRFF